mmetsp:Transcript_76101/g.134383  ORF Transcript_76101/g.134383 Transcript_76101/m.134383 type:complete len:511 (-) Transcript_76101:4-1536(-)
MGCTRSRLRRGSFWLRIWHSDVERGGSENDFEAFGQGSAIIPDGEDKQVPDQSRAPPGSVDNYNSSFELADEEQLTLELLQSFAPSARSFIISTVNDDGLGYVQAFKSKGVKFLGDIRQSSFRSEGIGYSCLKGLKPDLPNQDSFVCMKLQGVLALYGVFDGHGREGHCVSEFVKDVFPRVLMKQSCLMSNPSKALESTFAQTQELIQKADSEGKMDAKRSGTTATVVFHHVQQRVMYIAHVGDSSCVLAKRVETPTANEIPPSSGSDDSNDGSRSNASPVFEAEALTEDHKPQLPEEQARIEASGGQVRFDGVCNHRVYVRGQRYPGLNMSRSLGDLLGWRYAGLSCQPSICLCSLVSSPRELFVALPPDDDPEGAEDAVSSVVDNALKSREEGGSQAVDASGSNQSSRMLRLEADRLLLICSDGVWEVMKPHEAVKACSREGLTDPHHAATRLTANVWDRWVNKLKGRVVDDVTAILISLEDSHNLTSEERVQEGQAPPVAAEHVLLS